LVFSAGKKRRPFTDEFLPHGLLALNTLSKSQIRPTLFGWVCRLLSNPAAHWVDNSRFYTDLIFQCDFISFYQNTTYTCIYNKCNCIDLPPEPVAHAPIRVYGIPALSA